MFIVSAPPWNSAPAERYVSGRQLHTAPLEPLLNSGGAAINIWSLRDQE
jgi:hypothetical protein